MAAKDGNNSTARLRDAITHDLGQYEIELLDDPTDADLPPGMTLANWTPQVHARIPLTNGRRIQVVYMNGALTDSSAIDAVGLALIDGLSPAELSKLERSLTEFPPAHLVQVPGGPLSVEGLTRQSLKVIVMTLFPKAAS